MQAVRLFSPVQNRPVTKKQKRKETSFSNRSCSIKNLPGNSYKDKRSGESNNHKKQRPNFGANILLLCDIKNTKTIDLILYAAKKRNHNIDLVSSFDFLLNIKQVKIIKEKKITPLPKFDAVITRFNYPSLTVNSNILNYFKSLGLKYFNNKPKSIYISHNKFESQQLFSKNNIPTPNTFMLSSNDLQRKEKLNIILNDIKSENIVIKKVTGGQGKGVFKTKKNIGEIKELLDKNFDKKEAFLVQEFITPPENASNIRYVVVGDKIASVIKRIGPADEFRSNLENSDEIAVNGIHKEEIISLAATKLTGLDIAGVDIIRSKDGPQILEINSNPDLYYDTEATGIDIAGFIIKRIEEVLSKHK